MNAWVTFFMRGDSRIRSVDRPHDGGGRVITLHVDDQALTMHFPSQDDSAVVVVTNRLIEALGTINGAAQERILSSEPVEAAP